MPTNQNNNNNSSRQVNNNKQIVHVTVNTAPRRRKRTPSKPAGGAGSPATAVSNPVNVYSPSVYVPHQSTSVGGTGEPPSYFNTATTNQQAYLNSVAQNQMAHEAHHRFNEQYTQASIPGLSAGIPNQTASLTPDNVSVSSHHSIHQPESEHLSAERLQHHEEEYNIRANPMYNTTPTTPLHARFDEAGPSSPAELNAAQERRERGEREIRATIDAGPAEVHGLPASTFYNIINTLAYKKSKDSAMAKEHEIKTLAKDMGVEFDEHTHHPSDILDRARDVWRKKHPDMWARHNQLKPK